MRIRVLKEFHDINNFALVHKEGDIFECDEERGNRLVAFKYAEVVEEPSHAEAEAVIEDNVLALETEQPAERKKRARKTKE